jgi:hypothetical protein
MIAYMLLPGLSQEALVNAAGEFCDAATRAWAMGDSLKARLLVDVAAALAARRDQAKGALAAASALKRHRGRRRGDAPLGP